MYARAFPGFFIGDTVAKDDEGGGDNGTYISRAELQSNRHD